MKHALTVAEVAAWLRVSKPIIYRMIRNNDLPAMKLGRQLMVPRIAVEAFLAGQA